MTAGPSVVSPGGNSFELRVVPCSGNGSRIKAIRCSVSTVDAIRRRATEQFLSIPRGGLEVGGLLFGTVEEEGILISGYSEVRIEYVSGPSFRLSSQDEVQLQLALAEAQSSGVIGWWHSHTRTDTSLTEEDAKVHSRFFGAVAPIALIIKPHKFDPAQIAVYGSDERGELIQDACCRFVSGEKEPEPQVEVIPEAVVAPVLAQPVAPPPMRLVGTTARPGPGRSRKRLGIAAALALVCFGIAVGTALVRTVREAPQPNSVQLELANAADGVTIRWSVPPPVAQSAASAELSIIDERGRSRTLALQPNEIQSGSVMYGVNSETLQIRLRVRSHENEIHDVTANFIGTVAASSAEPRPAAVVATEHAVQVEPPRHEETRTRTTEEEKPERVPVRVARLPAIPRRDVPIPVVSAPPTLQIGSVGPPAVPAGISGTLTLPAPRPSPPKLASGRAIWTGTLVAGSTLLIDGRRPTMGALTGSIPNRPLRVRVHAADLLDSGLVIYTASGEERFERPSAANGWNLTTYRPDPRRSRSLAVLETPAPTNGWQRLMVRTANRTLTALVIDWDELPTQQ